MEIALKRIYEPAAKDDGLRILVDRLWPRGISKERARLDAWVKDLAPSDALRHWYGHDPARWPEFKARYFAELDLQPDEVAALVDRIGAAHASFLFSSKERELNNAAALREYLLARR